MGRKPPGSVYKRCGCRKGRAGLRLGTSCPRLAEDDHGSWFFSLDLPRHVGGLRRRVRRGGYATRQEAECALRRLRLPGGRVLTVADWLEIWLTARVKLRSTTMRGYSDLLQWSCRDSVKLSARASSCPSVPAATVTLPSVPRYGWAR